MRRYLKAAFCTILLLFGGTTVSAQRGSSFGDLIGAVTDVTRARLPGAKVNVSDLRRGIERSIETDEKGEYRFRLLPPGDYEVRVELEAFLTKVVQGVRVTVGETAVLDVELDLGSTFEVLVVEGTTRLVDPEQSQQASTIEQESIQNLPINRRDYLSFAQLAPGVSSSERMVDNSDFRLPQLSHSGLSFFGSNGRRNAVTVDGGEANDGSGGVRSTLSQEAIQEFQINRSNFSAELGGASGGVINIVSKSGTNEIHGSVFGFFRHQRMDAGDPFARVLQGNELVRVKPPSKRGQFGATLGLPLKKDRTFLFASFEGLVRRESSVVSLLTDMSIFEPTPEQEELLRQLPPDQAAPLRAALTSPPSTVQLFQNNSGVFPYETDRGQVALRFDHRATDRDQLLFRFSHSDILESNANLQALVGASRGLIFDQYDPTALLGWTRSINPQVNNEFRAQFNYRSFSLETVEKLGPELRIAGFGVFNRDNLLPSRAIERRLEFRDNLSLQKGNHLIKTGVHALIRSRMSQSEVFFGGRFTFGDLPLNLLNPALPPELQMNALQAFNLGLAQTYLQATGDPSVASTNPFYGIYLQDSWKVRPNLQLDYGLRYELDTRKRPVPTDKNNFAPRFGFAWDPAGDGKTTVRGGYGIFYAPIYYQIDWSATALNEINGFRQIPQAFSSILTPGPAAANNIFTVLRQQGVIGVPVPERPVTPQDVAQFGISFPQTGPLPPFSLLFENSDDFASPYAQQASLGVERQIGRHFSIHLSGIYVRTLKITRSRDSNLRRAPIDPALGIPVWSSFASFVDPFLAQRNVFESTAQASYAGLIVEFRKRFSQDWSLNANYTFSKAIDDIVDATSDFQANDQTNLFAEKARSSFDQTHAFTAYGLWDVPGNFSISPIFRATSGKPFNLLAGFDLNQDRHDTTDRPASAGRNTGRGPRFWTLDLRVSRSVQLRDKLRLELIAEAFNLFNRQNFASVNNTVGNIAGPFRLTGRRDRSPSEPLGFSSAFDARKVQLGVRLLF